MTRFRIALSAWVLVTSGVAISTTNVRAEICSHPPFNEVHADEGSADWSTLDSDCVLTSSLHTDAYGPAAGVAHFRRNPEAPLRLRFKVDITALEMNLLTQAATLASGTSRTAYPTENPQAHVFRVDVVGHVQGPRLALLAACQSNPSHVCTHLMPIEGSTPTIGLELDVGAGAEGELRLWVDKTFEETPSATLSNLDNAGWIGVDRIGLGLSSASASFRSSFGDQAVVFSEIEYNDDQLLWSDFESDHASNCVGPFQPLFALAQNAGNTCSGTSNILPVLASGTTRSNSEEIIYTLSSEGEGNPFNLHIESFGEHDTSALVCERTCGPIKRCFGGVHAEANGTGYRQFQLPVGEYDLVVTSLKTCGEYNVLLQYVNE